MTRHAERLLSRPIGGAQSGRCFEQLGLAGFSGPVAFKREFQFTPRTDARRTERSDRKFQKRHSFNPLIGGKGHGGCVQEKSRERRLLGAPPGHPARGRIMLSGQVSWLTGRRCCPAFPKPAWASVTFVGQRLAAYSCGGSAGITPASLLAPDQAGPGEPRRNRISGSGLPRQPEPSRAAGVAAFNFPSTGKRQRLVINR